MTPCSGYPIDPNRVQDADFYIAHDYRYCGKSSVVAYRVRCRNGTVHVLTFCEGCGEGKEEPRNWFSRWMRKDKGQKGTRFAAVKKLVNWETIIEVERIPVPLLQDRAKSNARSDFKTAIKHVMSRAKYQILEEQDILEIVKETFAEVTMEEIQGN